MKNSAKKSQNQLTVQNVVNAIVEDQKINQLAIDKLNALNLSEKITDGKKSIFKADKANKKDRTKCRDKFQNRIGLYLISIKHGKSENAEKYLSEIKEIAKENYKAEDSFKNLSDYCTDNMSADKKMLIDTFLEFQKEI